jgi:ribokinase
MGMNRHDVVVVGGANTDFWVRGPNLPVPGSTLEGTSFHESPGGKGANQAVASARLGAKTALLACLGSDDRGDVLFDSLTAEHVETAGVVRDLTRPTGAALVMVDERGEKQVLTAPGANEGLTAQHIAAFSTVLISAKVVLLALEVPLETVAAAARIARAAGAYVILNPSPARLLHEELLRDLHVIRPNADEAEFLTGIEVKSRADARRAAENLLRRGAGSALIGAPGGDLLLTPEEETWLPHHHVEVVDKTGAGDAFTAGLAVGLSEGKRLREAARFASATAALSITSMGARGGLPKHEQVLELMSSEVSFETAPA